MMISTSIKLIEAKRLRLDDELAKIRGVHFFISSLTGINPNATESSAKKAGKRKRKGQNEDISPNNRASLLKMITAKHCFIMVWHILLPIHQVIRAIKTRYLNCSIKVKWKQLYIKLELVPSRFMMTKMNQ